MKKFFTALIIFLSISGFAFANTATVVKTTVPKPVYTSFDNCYKFYSADCEKLFLVVLAGLNANNYKIIELQSRNSLVIFKADNKEFLASISKVDAKSAMLRITPADNSYAFSPTVISRIFQYVTENINLPLQL